MAVFKCKMCGASLEVNNESTVQCKYCDSMQTLPKLTDDRISNLYDRANHFRRNNEFDKAANTYEKILNEDKTDAEAYWSLVLCRYGIEYVEDPVTHKRIPTVNRTQFTSIYDDDNYKMAINYSDASQRSVYEAEAKAINDIQKGILAISQKEKPFDVFICYKETDNNGKRTPDSVLANDLYHQLTNEGFKVFFSRITLEDKLGEAYEPYIFAALNSAKVMVVLGTKAEYFNAVWVRNEWSRYLSLIKSGGERILIPAYKDMDPYDLPEEFSHLQAQDMSKLGFMQDLIRGIKKLTVKDEPKVTTVVKERTVVNGGGGNVDTLLKRVEIFLGDRDFKSANEYCEKVLDIDPENALAYLGKLQAEFLCPQRASLKTLSKSFKESLNYQKVLRYGDDSLKDELSIYLAEVNNRIEYNNKKQIYDKARNSKRSDSIFDINKAIGLFKSIDGFEDVDTQIKECEQKIEAIKKEDARRAQKEVENTYSEAKALMKNNTQTDLNKAIELFQKISGHKDSDSLIEECTEKLADLAKNVVFQKAYDLLHTNKIDKVKEAQKLFRELNGWHDSAQMVNECDTVIDKLVKEKEEQLKAKKKKEKRVIIFGVACGAFILLLLILLLLFGKYVTFYIKDNAQIEIDGIVYKKTEDGVKVVDCYGWETDENVVIKDSIMGKEVVIIGAEAFKYTDEIKTVVIPDTVTVIESPEDLSGSAYYYFYGAFSGCVNLESITLSNSLEYIGGGAFEGCSSLKEIVIPSTVTVIGKGAFHGCSSLNSVTFECDIRHIPEGMFADCSSLTEFTIPDGIENIGKYAFDGCTELKDITIPSSVLEIDDHAFGFGDMDSITIHCYINTNAFRFAEDHGAKIEIIE